MGYVTIGIDKEALKAAKGVARTAAEERALEQIRAKQAAAKGGGGEAYDPETGGGGDSSGAGGSNKTMIYVGLGVGALIVVAMLLRK